MTDPPPEPTPETPAELADRLQAAAELMESLISDPTPLAEIDAELHKRFMKAAGLVSKPTKLERRRLTRAKQRKEAKEKRARDRAVLDTVGIRRERANPIFQTPRRLAVHTAGLEPAQSEPVARTETERVCYACQAAYHDVHHFYDQMCLPCGDLNFAKRTATTDLTGRVALVTGARVKIGYQAAILLLRAGCRVIVLTRFPRDAARRYAAEADFADWGERLEIHGIDLRDTVQVEALCALLLQTHTRLDFIINNACQTVRRPPGFYDHLMDGEQGAALSVDEARLLAGSANALTPAGSEQRLSSAEMTQLELLAEDRLRGQQLFPQGRLDADLQQVDLREVNSWRLRLHEVPTLELLEVHLVNAVAPFVLNARLKPLMLAVPTPDKHIVNVSAMEGQFYRTFKSDKHPHTNMAKASLNMLTRTSAIDYIADGIHMNSVDTGWVTDEDPIHHAERKREEHNFHPPLDIVDGAARICDPIIDGIATGNHVWGQFLKDYKPTDW